MQQQLEKTIRREDVVDEHLLILNTIVTDLTNDVKDIIDFMTYTKNGAILTHLLPIETIVTELREATTLLANYIFLLEFKQRTDELYRNILLQARITITLVYI